MGTRTTNGQNLHDLVIQTAYNLLDKVEHDVYINPNQQKNTHIRNNYPDIIITDKGSKTAKFIIEVETADSVNLNETEQWKAYSNLGGTFYLLIPIASKVQAELLCQQQGIKARFGTFRVEASRIIIHYE